MAIDTSIYGNIQQYKAPDQLNQIAQMMQIQGAQNQGALAQYTLKKAQREDEDNNALRAALSAPGADVGNALLQQGRVKEYSDYQKAQADAGKLKAETSKFDAETESKKLEAAHKRVDMFGQAAGWLRQNPTPENAIAVTQHLVQNGILTPEQAQASVAKIQADPSPEGISRMATMAYQTALSAKDQLPTYQTRNTGGATDTVAIDPVTGKVTVANSVKNTQSPDNAATNSTHLQGINIQQAGENSRQKQTLAKDFAVAGLNPDGTPGGDIETTAKAIASGQLPPPSGMALTNPKNQRILSRVMEINPNYDYTTVTAKKKAASDFTTGNLGNSMRSFQVAGQHLDQLGELVDALNNGNTQIVNKIGNAFAAQTGNPAPTNFDAAKDVVSKEVVKAIVAGGGGVSERQELSHLMDNAKSPAQLKGVIQQYRNLMAAQHDALLQQRRAAGLSDSTLPNYNEAGGGGTAGTAAVPSDIADILKKHGGR